MIACVPCVSSVVSHKAIFDQAIKTIFGHLHHLPSVESPTLRRPLPTLWRGGVTRRESPRSTQWGGDLGEGLSVTPPSARAWRVGTASSRAVPRPPARSAGLVRLCGAG